MEIYEERHYTEDMCVDKQWKMNQLMLTDKNESVVDSLVVGSNPSLGNLEGNC